MIASTDSGLDEILISNAYENQGLPQMKAMPNSTKPRYTGILSKQSKLKDQTTRAGSLWTSIEDDKSPVPGVSILNTHMTNSNAVTLNSVINRTLLSNSDVKSVKKRYKVAPGTSIDPISNNPAGYSSLTKVLQDPSASTSHASVKMQRIFVIDS